MSTTSLKPQIPKSISDKLQKLRGQISRFLLVDGFSKILAVVVVIALVDLVLDRGFKMDRAQRMIMLCVMAGIVAAVTFFRLFKPFSKDVGDDALLLQVEDSNKELKESVISAAQLSREDNFEARGVSPVLVDATIKRGTEMAEKVDFGNTLDGGAMARNTILLLASVIAIGGIGYGVAKTTFWRTWFNRNILLSNDQWPRSTNLEIEGIVDGQLELMRGEDYKQVVRVNPDSRKTDVNVSIEFDDGFNRTTEKMQRSKLEHTLVFRNVTTEFRFRAKGGDHTTDWIKVTLVDPPEWSELKMTASLPEYTGFTEQELPAGGGPHTVLAGSTLKIAARPNKPLTSAELFNEENVYPIEKSTDGQYLLTLNTDDLQGGKYSFRLTDEKGRTSSRPTTFSLKIKKDQVPSVRARMEGISGMVVTRARIPVRFTAGDEFSVSKLEFEFGWKGDSASSVGQTQRIDLVTLEPKNQAGTNQLRGKLGSTEIKHRSTLDMEGLNIPAGVSMELSIKARDNNPNRGEAEEGTSREFLLRVVTDDQLRADLLRREIEQRKAFELILKNQERLLFDLQAVSDSANSAADMEPAETLDRILDSQRRQKLVGTNIARIADRFEDFLVEVKNNRLDEAEDEFDKSQTIEVRFNDRIIKPIRELDSDTMIVKAARLIELCQRYTDGSVDKPNLITGLKTAMTKQREIIVRMEKILSAMQDSETFQEIVNKVIEIKTDEEGVRKMARETQEQSGSRGVFDENEDDDGMFEDDEDGDNTTDEDKKKDGDGKP